MSDDFESDGWFDEEDAGDFDADWESQTISCPECGFPVYDDAEMCPRCGHFIEEADLHPLAGKPPWFLILGLLGVLATIIALSGLF